MTNIRLLFLNIVVILIFIACTTQDGIVNTDKGRGIVAVRITNSDVAADIFINQMNTQKVTPKEFELTSGTYTIKLTSPGLKFSPDSVLVTIQEDEKDQVIEALFESKLVASGNLKLETQLLPLQVTIDGLKRRSRVEYNGLPKGKHDVKIAKPGYIPEIFTVDIKENETSILTVDLESKGKIFLLEHFSNVNCDPCVEREEDLDDYMVQHDSLAIIDIGYHPNFPAKADPIYTAALEENKNRTDYYDVGSTPSFFINGTKIYTYSKKHIFRGLDQYITDNAVDSSGINDFNITIEEYLNKITGVVQLRTDKAIPENTFLRIALIQRNVIFNKPPGTNGQKEFKNIVREMVPTADGMKISIDSDERQQIVFKFFNIAAWEKDLQVVAFIQNDESREILAVTESIIINQN